MKHKGSSTTSRKNKSLCEKSMILVANVIKLSSLSLGNIHLATTMTRPPPNPAEAPAKVTKVDVPDPQSPRSPQKRLREPENESKPFSFVMQLPSTDQNTSTTIAATSTTSTQSSDACKNSKSEAGSDVDGRAEAYIKRVHGKIQNQNDQPAVNPTPSTTTAGIVSSKRHSHARPAPAPKISKQHLNS
ncbi:hypothetical protein ACFX13_021443 [Malus domestica]